jgi:hypothetical protein
MTTKLEIARIIYESDDLDVGQKLMLIRDINEQVAMNFARMTTKGGIPLGKIKTSFAHKVGKALTHKIDASKMINKSAKFAKLKATQGARGLKRLGNKKVF